MPYSLDDNTSKDTKRGTAIELAEEVCTFAPKRFNVSSPF